MDGTTLAIIFGLTAAAFWGVADFFAARASKTIGPMVSAFFVNAIGASAFLLVYLLFLHPPFDVTTRGLTYVVTASLAISFGAIAFFRCLKAGPVSIVSPISGSYPLITTLMALAVFHAHLSPAQVLGIVLVVAGVSVASEVIGKQRVKKIGNGPLWAVATAIGWGVGFSLLAQAIGEMGWEVATLIELVLCAVIIGVLLPFTKGDENISFKALKHAGKNRFIIAAALIQTSGALALNLGLANETASGAIVTALSGCYPVLTVFLALRHFKEEIKLIPLAGGLVTVIGAIIISVG
ncbi:MAG TPA: EamA family transporter [Candidatus Saccharimonadales bacterium]|nr:EamA family transporter [Candidatus Saccharimonadales bacterium]